MRNAVGRCFVCCIPKWIRRALRRLAWPCTIWCRKEEQESESQDSHAAESEDGSPPMVLELEPSTSCPTQFIDYVGKGRFCELWTGQHRTQPLVRVKVYSLVREEQWMRETKIYQTVCMRHEHVLSFVASEVRGTGLLTQLLLITDYPKRGSLRSYLRKSVLTYTKTLTACRSFMSGLTHLHSEFYDRRYRATKPGIVHRDVNPDNIFVKANGECAFGNFTLAIRHNSKSNETDATPKLNVGTPRYMAPEELDGTLDTSKFDNLKKADVYAAGLVLWEICKRCASRTSRVEKICRLPYYEFVSSHPGIEEMRIAVCEKGCRPINPTTWRDDPVLVQLWLVIRDCWHKDPTTRSTAYRLLKKLSKCNIHDLIE